MEQRNFNYIILIALIAGLATTIGLQVMTFTQIGTISGTPTGGEAGIRISGSTTCFPVMENASVTYMNDNPSITIAVSSGGSGQGVDDLAAGITDIGMTSRPIKDSEKAEHSGTDILEWTDWKFAKDGVTIIASDELLPYWVGGTPNMTLKTIFEIYNGNITSWNDVPGFSGVPGGQATIVPLTREGGSGTRETFEKYVKVEAPYYTENWGELEDDAAYQAVVSSYGVADGNPAMSQEVTDGTAAIGYVGLAYVDDANQIKFNVAYNSSLTPIEPKQSTILDATYPISRFLHLWTTPTASAATLNFINYIFSPEGQAIVFYEGYVPLYDLSPYDFLYMN
ncbi:MAG: extracellular solute-binding protein [Candidatus Lokiarchaeota archaeon]|nr:extracellular solute-binding protein [Candidatus Lokiarchaeota archaeon]